MLRNLILIFLVLAASSLYAQGWQAEAEAYERNVADLETRTPPKQYRSVNYKGDVLTKAVRPELCIGVHTIDEKAVRDLKELGISTVRTTLYWDTVETEKGVYSPEALAACDRSFGLLLRNGIMPLVVVHEAPAYASFAQRGAAYRAFAGFMTMCVTRWPRIKYWELWNEMDSAFTDLFGAENPRIPLEARGRYYAEMLKTAYPAIKKANPGAIVVLGGIAGSITPFMEGVYKGGGKGYFDVMNLHTYGMPLAWSFVNRGIEARKVLERFGDGQKPIWNTEFGTEAGSYIAAWGKPQTLEEFDNIQAQYLTELAALNKKTCLYDKCFIFQYKAACEGGQDEIKDMGGDPEDYTYGIVRANGDRRPAFEALRRLKIND